MPLCHILQMIVIDTAIRQLAIKQKLAVDFCPFPDYNAFCPFKDNICREAFILADNTDKYNEYTALLDQYDKELDDIYHYYALRYNLSDAALWILYAVYGSEEGVTQADICNCWFFSRQTINTALQGLAQQEIIRLKPIPGNRKSKHVLLTVQGQKLVQQIIVPLKQAENQVFASFSDEENQLFVEMARKRCSLLRKFLEMES